VVARRDRHFDFRRNAGIWPGSVPPMMQLWDDSCFLQLFSKGMFDIFNQRSPISGRSKLADLSICGRGHEYLLIHIISRMGKAVKRAIFIRVALVLAAVLAILAAACGGPPEPTPAPTPTPRPTATPRPPAPTPQPTVVLTPAEQVAACLEGVIGPEGAEAALSKLITTTPEQKVALNQCLVASSFGVGQAADPGVLACLTELLGGTVARVAASGLLPLSNEESAILGNCVLTGSASALAGIVDPIVACLEERLDGDQARDIASGTVALTVEQENLLGNCVLSSGLAAGGGSLPDGVLECVSAALGGLPAQDAVSNFVTINPEREAALGGCLLLSALNVSDEANLAAGIMACLVHELGFDAAQIVATAVTPLSPEEGQALGRCVLTEGLGLGP